MRNQKYYDTVGLIGGGPPQDIPKVLNPTVISYKTGFKIPPINYSLQYLVLHRFNPPVKYNLPPNSLVEADTLESYVFDAFSKVTCQQAAIIYRLTGLDFGPEIMTKTQYCGKFFLASFKDIAQTFTKEPYFLSLAKLGSDDTYVSFSVPVEQKKLSNAIERRPKDANLLSIIVGNVINPEEKINAIQHLEIDLDVD